MGAYNYMDTAILGLAQGILGVTDFFETINCQEPNGITYGYPIFSPSGNTGIGYNAHQTQAVITTSGAFTSSDTAIIVTLNGVALSSVAYSSSSAHTGSLVVVAILAALPTGSTCVFNDSAHTFTIYSPGQDLTATLASSGGVTATTAYTVGASDLFMGVAGFTQRSLRSTAGGYTQNDPMNSMYLGFIYVQCPIAVTDGQSAYVIVDPTAVATINSVSTKTQGSLLTLQPQLVQVLIISRPNVCLDRQPQDLE